MFKEALSLLGSMHKFMRSKSNILGGALLVAAATGTVFSGDYTPSNNMTITGDGSGTADASITVDNMGDATPPLLQLTADTFGDVSTGVVTNAGVTVQIGGNVTGIDSLLMTNGILDFASNAATQDSVPVAFEMHAFSEANRNILKLSTVPTNWANGTLNLAASGTGVQGFFKTLSLNVAGDVSGLGTISLNGTTGSFIVGGTLDGSGQSMAAQTLSVDAAVTTYPTINAVDATTVVLTNGGANVPALTNATAATLELQAAPTGSAKDISSNNGYSNIKLSTATTFSGGSALNIGAKTLNVDAAVAAIGDYPTINAADGSIVSINNADAVAPGLNGTSAATLNLAVATSNAMDISAATDYDTIGLTSAVDYSGAQPLTIGDNQTLSVDAAVTTYPTTINATDLSTVVLADGGASVPALTNTTAATLELQAAPTGNAKDISAASGTDGYSNIKLSTVTDFSGGVALNIGAKTLNVDAAVADTADYPTINAADGSIVSINNVAAAIPALTMANAADRAILQFSVVPNAGPNIDGSTFYDTLSLAANQDFSNRSFTIGDNQTLSVDAAMDVGNYPTIDAQDTSTVVLTDGSASVPTTVGGAGITNGATLELQAAPAVTAKDISSNSGFSNIKLSTATDFSGGTALNIGAKTLNVDAAVAATGDYPTINAADGSIVALNDVAAAIPTLTMANAADRAILQFSVVPNADPSIATSTVYDTLSLAANQNFSARSFTIGDNQTLSVDAAVADTADYPTINATDGSIVSINNADAVAPALTGTSAATLNLAVATSNAMDISAATDYDTIGLTSAVDYSGAQPLTIDDNQTLSVDAAVTIYPTTINATDLSTVVLADGGAAVPTTVAGTGITNGATLELPAQPTGSAKDISSNNGFSNIKLSTVTDFSGGTALNIGAKTLNVNTAVPTASAYPTINASSGAVVALNSAGADVPNLQGSPAATLELTVPATRDVDVSDKTGYSVVKLGFADARYQRILLNGAEHTVELDGVTTLPGQNLIRSMDDNPVTVDIKTTDAPIPGANNFKQSDSVTNLVGNALALTVNPTAFDASYTLGDHYSKLILSGAEDYTVRLSSNIPQELVIANAAMTDLDIATTGTGSGHTLTLQALPADNGVKEEIHAAISSTSMFDTLKLDSATDYSSLGNSNSLQLGARTLEVAKLIASDNYPNDLGLTTGKIVVSADGFQNANLIANGRINSDSTADVDVDLVLEGDNPQIDVRATTKIGTVELARETYSGGSSAVTIDGAQNIKVTAGTTAYPALNLGDTTGEFQIANANAGLPSVVTDAANATLAYTAVPSADITLDANQGFKYVSFDMAQDFSSVIVELNNATTQYLINSNNSAGDDTHEPVVFVSDSGSAPVVRLASAGARLPGELKYILQGTDLATVELGEAVGVDISTDDRFDVVKLSEDIDFTGAADINVGAKTLAVDTDLSSGLPTVILTDGATVSLNHDNAKIPSLSASTGDEVTLSLNAADFAEDYTVPSEVTEVNLAQANYSGATNGSVTMESGQVLNVAAAIVNSAHYPTLTLASGATVKLSDDSAVLPPLTKDTANDNNINLTLSLAATATAADGITVGTDRIYNELEIADAVDLSTKTYYLFDGAVLTLREDAIFSTSRSSILIYGNGAKQVNIEKAGIASANIPEVTSATDTAADAGMPRLNFNNAVLNSSDIDLSNKGYNEIGLTVNGAYYRMASDPLASITLPAAAKVFVTGGVNYYPQLNASSSSTAVLGQNALVLPTFTGATGNTLEIAEQISNSDLKAEIRLNFEQTSDESDYSGYSKMVISGTKTESEGSTGVVSANILDTTSTKPLYMGAKTLAVTATGVTSTTDDNKLHVEMNDGTWEVGGDNIANVLFTAGSADNTLHVKAPLSFTSADADGTWNYYAFNKVTLDTTGSFADHGFDLQGKELTVKTVPSAYGTLNMNATTVKMQVDDAAVPSATNGTVNNTLVVQAVPLNRDFEHSSYDSYSTIHIDNTTTGIDLSTTSNRIDVPDSKHLVLSNTVGVAAGSIDTSTGKSNTVELTQPSDFLDVSGNTSKLSLSHAQVKNRTLQFTTWNPQEPVSIGDVSAMNSVNGLSLSILYPLGGAIRNTGNVSPTPFTYAQTVEISSDETLDFASSSTLFFNPDIMKFTDFSADSTGITARTLKISADVRNMKIFSAMPTEADPDADPSTAAAYASKPLTVEIASERVTQLPEILPVTGGGYPTVKLAINVPAKVDGTMRDVPLAGDVQPQYAQFELISGNLVPDNGVLKLNGGNNMVHLHYANENAASISGAVEMSDGTIELDRPITDVAVSDGTGDGIVDPFTTVALTADSRNNTLRLSTYQLEWRNALENGAAADLNVSSISTLDINDSGYSAEHDSDSAGVTTDDHDSDSAGVTTEDEVRLADGMTLKLSNGFYNTPVKLQDGTVVVANTDATKQPMSADSAGNTFELSLTNDAEAVAFDFGTDIAAYSEFALKRGTFNHDLGSAEYPIDGRTVEIFVDESGMATGKKVFADNTVFNLTHSGTGHTGTASIGEIVGVNNTLNIQSGLTLLNLNMTFGGDQNISNLTIDPSSSIQDSDFTFKPGAVGSMLNKLAGTGTHTNGNSIVIEGGVYEDQISIGQGVRMLEISGADMQSDLKIAMHQDEAPAGNAPDVVIENVGTATKLADTIVTGKNLHLSVSGTDAAAMGAFKTTQTGNRLDLDFPGLYIFKSEGAWEYNDANNGLIFCSENSECLNVPQAEHAFIEATDEQFALKMHNSYSRFGDNGGGKSGKASFTSYTDYNTRSKETVKHPKQNKFTRGLQAVFNVTDKDATFSRTMIQSEFSTLKIAGDRLLTYSGAAGAERVHGKTITSSYIAGVEYNYFLRNMSGTLSNYHELSNYYSFHAGAKLEKKLQLAKFVSMQAGTSLNARYAPKYSTNEITYKQNLMSQIAPEMSITMNVDELSLDITGYGSYFKTLTGKTQQLRYKGQAGDIKVPYKLMSSSGYITGVKLASQLTERVTLAADLSTSNASLYAASVSLRASL